jgi:hypothetical protein
MKKYVPQKVSDKSIKYRTPRLRCVEKVFSDCFHGWIKDDYSNPNNCKDGYSVS